MRTGMMVKNILISSAVILMMATDSGASVAQKETNDQYKLVFSDEFNQADGTQPDPTKWSRAERNPSIWARWISDSKDVVYIKNGRLICRAIPNKHLDSDSAKMLTGAIETLGKFSFQYGKVEVRMRTNSKVGNFPAAWMKAIPDHPDKRYGEIDIVEMFGKIPQVYHTVHNHMSFTLKKKNGPMREFKEKVSFTKWHVYGLEWDKDLIVWTVDGKKVGEFRREKSEQMIKNGQWTFDRPFYLRLNQSVGDGSHERLQSPNIKKTYETQFDWIRVYQKK